jgi:hypothetical protein
MYRSVSRHQRAGDLVGTTVEAHLCAGKTHGGDVVESGPAQANGGVAGNPINQSLLLTSIRGDGPYGRRGIGGRVVKNSARCFYSVDAPFVSDLLLWSPFNRDSPYLPSPGACGAEVDIAAVARPTGADVCGRIGSQAGFVAGLQIEDVYIGLSGCGRFISLIESSPDPESCPIQASDRGDRSHRRGTRRVLSGLYHADAVDGGS